MKALGHSILVLAAAAGSCFAQQWEFGIAEGASILRKTSITTPAGGANAEFRKGAMFSVFFGQNQYRYLSGELRYGYVMSDLRLSSNNTHVTAPGSAHLVHYDFLLHTNGRSRAQVFAAFGGGVRVFELKRPDAPLPTLGTYLGVAKTETIKPVASFGGGVKFGITQRLFLRAEFRDYISPFPTEAIVLGPNVKFTDSTLHNFVPMAGLSVTF